jgi:hypothetical protein
MLYPSEIPRKPLEQILAPLAKLTEPEGRSRVDNPAQIRNIS